MSDCCGFDLSGSDWVVLETEIHPRGQFEKPITRQHTKQDERPEEILAKAFRECLRVTLHTPISPNGFTEDGLLKNRIQTLRVLTHKLISSGFRDRDQRKQDHNVVGIAFPYDFSPPIRRVLPLAVNGQQLPPYGPVRSRDHSVVLIDAPSAACVELLASHRFGVPKTEKFADLITLCGGPGSCELAVIRVSGEATTLRLDFLAYTRFGPDLSAQAVRDQLARSLPSWSNESRSVTGFFVADPALHDVADTVGHVLMLPPDCRLQVEQPRFVVAGGAARFAALWRDVVLRGTEFTHMKVTHIVPHPIGVIGRYRETHSCWRRLISAGDRFPESGTLTASSTAGVSVGEPGQQNEPPNLVLLAELTDPKLRDREWLSSEAWNVEPGQDSPVRVFTPAMVNWRGVGAGSQVVLEFQLENLTGSRPSVAQKVLVEATAPVAGAEGR